MNLNYNFSPDLANVSSTIPILPPATKKLKTAMKNKAHSDRFIPYQGSKRDHDIVQYKMTSSKILEQESYWTPYRSALAEGCFDMDVKDFRKLGVHLWKPAPQLDHSITAEYKRLNTVTDVGTTVLKTKAPRLLKALAAPQVLDDFYLNLMDLSSQNVCALALLNDVHYLSSDRQSCLKRDADTDEIYVSSVKWVNAGHHLAVGDKAGMLQIWDIERNFCQRTISSAGYRIGVSATSNDDSLVIFTGSRDGGIRKLDLRVKAAQISYWQAGIDDICGLSISPDEKYIASGSNDNSVRLYDVNAGSYTEPLSVIKSHGAAVKGLAWHQNSHYLFTGGGGSDRSIKMWDMNHPEAPTLLCSEKTDNQITSLQWVKNRLFSTGGLGGSSNPLAVRKVDLINRQMFTEHEVVAHDNRILISRLSKDQTRLFTLGVDEAVKIWDISESVVQPQRPVLGGGTSSLISQFSNRWIT